MTGQRRLTLSESNIFGGKMKTNINLYFLLAIAILSGCATMTDVLKDKDEGTAAIYEIDKVYMIVKNNEYIDMYKRFVKEHYDEEMIFVQYYVDKMISVYRVEKIRG